MVRQCAWCLCLIDSIGERLSPLPLPKLYEASHGMCSICGSHWMEQVQDAQPVEDIPLWNVDIVSDMVSSVCMDIQGTSAQSITDLVLELQHHEPVI